MNRTENSRTPTNTLRSPHSPTRASPRPSPRKNRQSIGCYTKPRSHSPPPSFGPDSVPPAVASQLDSYFEEQKKSKQKKIVEPPIPETPRLRPSAANVESDSISEKFSLCVPKNPQRFSRRKVRNSQNHPSQSILQNPQRIVSNGPFAITEPVKPSIVSLHFDGLQPLRLNNTVSNPDAKKTLRDLQILVNASIRSKNINDEASSYFQIGLIHENEGHLKRANEYYTKYIQTLGSDADPLVFNRIAVNYQLLQQYDEAIEWNQKHLSLSRSVFETIAANCNIALIYKEIGDRAKSVEYYRAALDEASEIDESQDSPFYSQVEKIKSALSAQIELANDEAKVKDTGLNDLSEYALGDRLNKFDVNGLQVDAQEKYFREQARVSMDQGDLSTSYKALVNCAKLSCIFGDFDKAEECYLSALDVANKIGSDDLVNHAKVAIGICRGNNELMSFGLFDGSKTPDVSLFADD